MADIQSNINVNIDTTEAAASIKSLQRQISAFYTSMARSGAAANAAVSNMQSNLINTINQTGAFSAQIRNIASTTEAFTTSLEKNKFSMGEYFRYAGGASKTFGRFFQTEMNTVEKVARERVKTLQTQFINLGRDANGALKSIAIRPLTLDMQDLSTQTAIAAQKQQVMNQLLKQGSTNLLNFGKNTQWAGRQLMVGFSIPLSMVGTAAAKTFMQMEEQAIKFKRVYGDSMTPTSEADAMVSQIRELATEFTKYGVAASKTMELAATAAAAGKQGLELTAQVREANRLAVLGQVEQQEALTTTISITNAFGTSATELAKKINFLNAVENQTVTSIEDLTIAVPKAGPVVKQLGGDVEDLAFFLTAMKEGGINASEGANALKSGLASLINPTEKASVMLAGFGINIKNIVESNKGNVKGIVIDFAKALDTLDPLNRARAIEQLFGKFQFSRLSTLFQNVVKDGTQASRVLELTGKSASELAALASKELGTVASSTMFKFQKAVEDLKVAIAPLGEIFLKLVTPVIEFGTKILENFNKLDEGVKNVIAGIVGVVGGLGPILIMTFGLLANGVANIIKGFMLVRRIFGKSAQDTRFLGDETEYMTQQQLEAASVAASLEQAHQKLEQRFTSEAAAVDKLTQALQRANTANAAYAGQNASVASAAAKPKKFAIGGIVRGPGTGKSDSIPAMLSNGEAVIPADSVAKNPQLVNALISGKIAAFSKGGKVGQGKRDRSSGFKVFTDFLGLISGSSNQELAQGIAKPSKIAGEFSLNPEAILAPMLVGIAEELGGAKSQQQLGRFFQNNPEVIQYGRELSLAIAEEVSSITAKTMGDEDLYAAVDRARQKVKTSPEIQKASDTIAQRGTTYEEDTVLRQRSSGALKPLGRERLTQQRGRYTTMFRRGLNWATRAGTQFPETPVAAHLSRPEEISIEQAKQLNLSKQATEAIQRKLREIQTIRGVGGKSVDVPLRSTTEQKRSAMRNAGIPVVGDSVATAITEGAKQGAKKATSKTTAAIEQGTNEAIQRNSPPKRALQIGRDYGIALNTELLRHVPKIKVAGASFGAAASQGIASMTPGMKQYVTEMAGSIVRPFVNAKQTLFPIETQRVKILDEQALAARRAAEAAKAHTVALKQEASQEMATAGAVQAGTAGELANDMENLSEQTGRQTTGLARFGSVVRNASFTLSSLAAVGTMAGGSFGEVSQNVMTFSALLFALQTVMDLAIAAQQKFVVATNTATGAQAAAGKANVLSTLLNFLTFSPGAKAAKAAGGLGFVASLKNAFVPLTGAFKAAGGGLKGFFGVLKNIIPVVFRVGGVFLRFIPVVGWIITAIGAFAFIVDQVNKAKEEERLKTEGVADAMSNTTEELNSLSEALGKDKTRTMFTDLGQGPATTQQTALVDQYRQNTDFLATYEKDIDELSKRMNQKEQKMFQDTLALKLQATGQYTQEEIEAVVKAIQLEAKKTTVKLEFAKIDITSKDPKVLQNNLKSLARNVASSFDQGLTEVQRTETRNIAAQGYFENYTAAINAFKNGVIDLPTYTQKLKDIKDSLNSLGEAGQKIVVQGMFSKFTDELKAVGQGEMAKVASGVKQFKDQLFIMDLVASGAITNITDLATVIKALNVIALGPKTAGYAGALVIVEEYKNKISASITEQEKLNNQFKDTGDKVNGVKSAFQTATEQLSDNIKKIRETQKAYSLLSKAGFAAADAMTLAEDPALATALATTKVGTKQWKTLTDLAKNFVAITRQNAFLNSVKSLNIENQNLKNFDAMAKYLQKAGLEAEDIQSILNDPVLLASFVDAMNEGEKGAKRINGYISALIKNKNFKMTIGVTLQDQFKSKMNDVQKWFENEENYLQLRFKLDTAGSEKIIREQQEKLINLNFQMDDYEAGLTRLEDQELAINEKYDARLEALDKVIQANDKIAEQNKQELNIFQLVAKGDIAGAAAGIAEMQQQKVRDALEQRRLSLETQRTNELESLTAEVVVNGQKVRMTRNQIETNLKDIKQQIFNIEENIIEPAQKQIDLAQAKLDKDNAALEVLGKTKLEWENIANGVELSVSRTTDYINALQRALDIAAQIPGALAGNPTGKDTPGQQDVTKETVFKQGKNNLPPVPKIGGPGGPGSGQTGYPTANTKGNLSPVAARTQTGNTGLTPEQEAAKAEYFRIHGKSDTVTPSQKELQDYQMDMYKIQQYESGNGFMLGINEWMYNDAKNNTKTFRSKYGSKNINGLWWTDPRINRAIRNSNNNPNSVIYGNDPIPKSTLQFATGGFVSGPGTATSDSIPALLSNGEFVIKAATVDKIGVNALNHLNRTGTVPAFKDGGLVGGSGSILDNPIINKLLEDNRYIPGPEQGLRYDLQPKFKDRKDIFGNPVVEWDSWGYGEDANIAVVTGKGKRKNLVDPSTVKMTPAQAVGYWVNVIKNRASNLSVITENLIKQNEQNGIFDSSANFIKKFSQLSSAAGLGEPLDSVFPLYAYKLAQNRAGIPGNLDVVEANNLRRALTEVVGAKTTKQVLTSGGMGWLYDRKSPFSRKGPIEIVYNDPFDPAPGKQTLLNVSTVLANTRVGLPRFKDGGPVDPSAGRYAAMEQAYKAAQAKGPNAIKNLLTPRTVAKSPFLAPVFQENKDGSFSTTSQTFANAISTRNATAEALAKKERDRLFKAGGAQGFEAGFQGMMSDFMNTNINGWTPIKNLSSFISTRPADLTKTGIFSQKGLTSIGAGTVRSLMGILSLPVNVVGALAKKTVTTAGQFSKGDVGGGLWTLLAANPLGDAVNSSIAGAMDPIKGVDSQFVQAAQQVIKDKSFGANNAESQALARIIGGSLDIVGDPVNYLGGAGALKGLKLAKVSAVEKLGPGLSGFGSRLNVLRDDMALSKVEKNIQKLETRAIAKAEKTFDPSKPGTAKELGLLNRVSKDSYLGIAGREKYGAQDPGLVRKTAKSLAEQMSYYSQRKLARFEAEQEYLKLMLSGDDNPEFTMNMRNSMDLYSNERRWKGLGVDFEYLNNILPYNYHEPGRLEQAIKNSERNAVQSKRAYEAAQDVLYGRSMSARRIRFISNLQDRFGFYGTARKINVGNANIRIFKKFMRIAQSINPRLAEKIYNKAGIHRSKNENLIDILSHPQEVPIDAGRVFGPGTYLAKNSKASDISFSNFGQYRYAISDTRTPKQRRQSKGYINEQQMYKEQKAFFGSSIPEVKIPKGNQWRSFRNPAENLLSGMEWDHPFIQSLISKGYTGYAHGDALTNWLVGVPGSGLGLKVASGANYSGFGLETNMSRIKPVSKLYNKLIDLNYYEKNRAFARLTDNSTLREFVSSFLMPIKTPKIDMRINKLRKQEEVLQRKLGINQVDPFENFDLFGTNNNGGFDFNLFAKGGLVNAKKMNVPKYFANGGLARGTDVVPAMLTPGEFIVSQPAVKNFGVDNLKAINNGTAAANSVYNGYNINVNVRSNSNPDQIANAVMTQIRQLNAQQVRGSRF